MLYSLSQSTSLVFLAPAGARTVDTFHRVARNYSLYESLTSKMQRLRGRLYVADGAISKDDLSSDGRHVLPADDQSWHLLSVAQSGEVLACTRYLEHAPDTDFSRLRVSHSPLATSDEWGAPLRSAVRQDLRAARAAGFSYIEVGGWAIAEQVRCTAECVRSVLATYAWSRLIGGAIGISTATERNGSASILRRLGGHGLNWKGAEIPPYYDRGYGCRMHMLRYDSRRPNPRYEVSVETIMQTLAAAPVVCPERPLTQPLFRGFHAFAESGPSADMARLAA